MFEEEMNVRSWMWDEDPFRVDSPKSFAREIQKLNDGVLVERITGKIIDL